MKEIRTGETSFTDFFSENTKPAIIHAAVFILMAAALGCLVLIKEAVYIKVIQVILVAALGCWNAAVLHRHLQNLNHTAHAHAWVYTLILSGIIYLLLLTLNYLTGSLMPMMALANSCAFLLPETVFQSWLFYAAIYKKENRIWFPESAPENDTTIFLNSISVRIQLALKYYDVEEVQFLRTVPLRIKLSKFFHQFLLEQNKSETVIEYLDEKTEKPYGWEFFAAALGGLQARLLNPDSSLADNNIKKNTIIYARRVKAEADSETEKYAMSV